MLGSGRYAPSPSGRLHVGNLRTAMLAWLFARSSGRRFLIRIEDVDRDRDLGAARTQLSELRALGLDWDGEPIWQSTRRQVHQAAITRLAERGLVYECYCTRREIHEAPRAPHALPGAYPGTCRALERERREQMRAAIYPRLPALRLRAPETQRSFDDLMIGQTTAGIDDFVLQRGDGVIGYHLACVVDDAEMEVTQVVRGDDLAASTPRQLLLHSLLGSFPPEYAHVPLVLSSSGARLAKRDGAVTLEQLAAQGIDAVTVRSTLACSLALARAGERVTMWQILQRFDPLHLPRAPWVWGSCLRHDPGINTDNTDNTDSSDVSGARYRHCHQR